jgi:hypothetical protein
MEKNPFLPSNPRDRTSGSVAPYKVSAPHKKTSNVRYSNYLITISTNYRPKSEGDYYDMAARLEELLHVAFNYQSMDRYVFDFIGDHKDDEWKTPYIVQAEANWGVELGRNSKGGRIHAHIIVEVAHKSKIWVNIQKLKDFFDEQLKPRVKGCRVHVKMIPADMQKALAYARKEQIPSGEVVSIGKRLQG